MKFSVSSTIALAGLVAAAPHPLSTRAKGITDADILNYALTLEHLEANFYREGLQNFTKADFANAGYDETFYKNLQEIASDELTHVKFITNGLRAAGAKHVKACEYNFPCADVQTFLATASVLEGVGVSAYLGAAASIMEDTYLTAAGSILTVEARHSAYIRENLDEIPYAQPFDNPLSFNEVYTLAAQFIVSCPSTNPPLPVKAFPALAATSSDSPIHTGSKVMLKPSKKLPSGQLYGAFITVTGPIFQKATKVQGGFEVTVPAGIAGQSYVVLTGSKKMVTDDTTVAGPAIVEVVASA